MKLVFALLVAASSIAFASSNPWVMIDQIQEFAVTEAEFIALQAKYPDYFEGYEPESVTAAHIVTTIYAYKGPNTCPANDPRLEAKQVSYGLCHLTDPGSDDDMICIDNVESMPDLKDPCATQSP